MYLSRTTLTTLRSIYTAAIGMLRAVINISANSSSTQTLTTSYVRRFTTSITAVAPCDLAFEAIRTRSI